MSLLPPSTRSSSALPGHLTCIHVECMQYTRKAAHEHVRRSNNGRGVHFVECVGLPQHIGMLLWLDASNLPRVSCVAAELRPWGWCWCFGRRHAGCKEHERHAKRRRTTHDCKSKGHVPCAHTPFSRSFALQNQQARSSRGAQRYSERGKERQQDRKRKQRIEGREKQRKRDESSNEAKFCARSIERYRATQTNNSCSAVRK